jgi:hypothetical protein
MKRVSLIFIIFVIWLFAFPQNIEAVTININNYPSTISSLDPFQVEVAVSGATNATNYLRADLYKEGTTNYFGETYNGSDWYNGSDGKLYFPVQIQNASVSATISVQIGNPTNTDYQGPGTYKLKIRRYTSSGSQSSNDTQTPADLQITYLFSTPTPTPTSSPTPTPTPTSTPVPTPTKTPIASPKPTVKAGTPTPIPTPSSQPEILGESTTLPTITPSSDPKTSESNNKFPILAFVLIGVGIIFVGLSGFMAYKMRYNNNNETKN